MKKRGGKTVDINSPEYAQSILNKVKKRSKKQQQPAHDYWLTD